MQDFTERLGIFITRCRLSDDPAAKAMMNRVDVSYLHAGISMQAMHEGCAAFSTLATPGAYIVVQRHPSCCLAYDVFDTIRLPADSLKNRRLCRRGWRRRRCSHCHACCWVTMHV